MVNTSKRKLKKETENRIHKQFIQTIVELKGYEDGKVLEDLLTDAEQIMLAKRLAAIAMLSQGAQPYQVSRVLKLSPSTPERLDVELENGAYEHIEKLLEDKKKKKQFWLELETLIRFGMPPMGKGRWKWLDDLGKK